MGERNDLVLFMTVPPPAHSPIESARYASKSVLAKLGHRKVHLSLTVWVWASTFWSKMYSCCRLGVSGDKEQQQGIEVVPSRSPDFLQLRMTVSCGSRRINRCPAFHSRMRRSPCRDHRPPIVMRGICVLIADTKIALLPFPHATARFQMGCY